MQYQSYIFGKNHWELEPDLPHILKRYWRDYDLKENDLLEFGLIAGGAAYETAQYVDRYARPVLVMHDMDGNRIDRVRLSPTHSAILKEMAFINRPPYEGGSWHHHFTYGFLLGDPGLYCSLIVTNQTAYAIYKYCPELKSWLEPLLSGNAWGATWMTETQGGSDLGANLTVAHREDDSWKLAGDLKYFASNAGLADIALVTARPEGARTGPKGIALFLVPRINPSNQLNFTIRRLKDKSATRAVPTGEVEFHDSQAYLVGQANLGIYYTLENLTVSRLANAIGAMGLARKAQLESLFRVQSRSAFGKVLIEHPLIKRDLTDLAVRIAGGLCLVFHAIEKFDESWNEKPPYTLGYHYARFLSHLAKNRTARHAAESTRIAMELFGGLGFLEEFPISRLHRETLVTAIWEGTSNIQALDMLEAMQKKGAHEPFLDEFIPLLQKINTPEAKLARQIIEASLSKIVEAKSDQVQWFSKDILTRLADAAQVALLYSLADQGGERYEKIANLFAHHFLADEPYPSWALTEREVWMPLM
jgi:acyl-CoA dehydrogenase